MTHVIGSQVVISKARLALAICSRAHAHLLHTKQPRLRVRINSRKETIRDAVVSWPNGLQIGRLNSSCSEREDEGF